MWHVILANASRESLRSDSVSEVSEVSDTEIANCLSVDFNFEGPDDEDHKDDLDEGDLMYDANDYGEAPTLEQSDGDMDVNFESPDDEDHEDDLDEEDLMYGINNYGEVSTLKQPEGGMDMDMLDKPGNDQEVENDLSQAQGVRWAAEEEFQKTSVVEAFPSARAGTSIPNIQALLRYNLYKTCLNNSDNPWTPFLSQLD